MFAYKDPSGNALKPAKALDNYRRLVHAQYREHAVRKSSAFTLLEAFKGLGAGDGVQEPEVPWTAFPRTANKSDAQIDADRFGLQDEYVEWRTERAPGGTVTRVTFTTEFAEFYEALAMVGMQPLVKAIKATGATGTPTAKDLFGPGFTPSAESPEARAAQFRAFLEQNPWNNGTKGILCLTQRFNTLGALFSLAGSAAIPKPGVPAGDVCGTLGDFCGPKRNSDPSIATAVQQLARDGLVLSLADPVGVQIAELVGIWRRNGEVFDVNDPAHNGGLWKISRNGRRAVLDVPADLTLGDDPITSGAQVAAKLRVKARVIAVAGSEVPEWARTGQEDARVSSVADGGSP